MTERNRFGTFEQAVPPHLDAAYNLARWLTRNERDAEDVAQEALLGAFRFFAGFRRGDALVWRNYPTIFVKSSFCANAMACLTIR